MRASKIILLSLALISLILILGHVMNLPGGLSLGWFTSPRVSKTAHVYISGKPINSHTWVSKWGVNHQEEDHPHEIISEIEIRVQHQTRSGLVEMRVTGDSVEDIDAFLETVRRDVNQTYNGIDKETGITIPNSYVHTISESSHSEYYWRQKYFGVLVCNVIALIFAFILLVRGSTKQAQSGRREILTPAPHTTGHTGP